MTRVGNQTPTKDHACVLPSRLSNYDEMPTEPSHFCNPPNLVIASGAEVELPIIEDMALVVALSVTNSLYRLFTVLRRDRGRQPGLANVAPIAEPSDSFGNNKDAANRQKYARPHFQFYRSSFVSPWLAVALRCFQKRWARPISSESSGSASRTP